MYFLSLQIANTLRHRFDLVLQLHPNGDTVPVYFGPLSHEHLVECKWHHYGLTYKYPSRFDVFPLSMRCPVDHYCYNDRKTIKIYLNLKLRKFFAFIRINRVTKIAISQWIATLKEKGERKAAYTSTKTGKAASRSSSRQLGGYNIWTCARVPCCNGISNECFRGSANSSRRRFIDEFCVLNNSCSKILVFIECTPIK